MKSALFVMVVAMAMVTGCASDATEPGQQEIAPVAPGDDTQDALEVEQTQSELYEEPMDAVDGEAACTNQQYVSASFHCDNHHGSFARCCRLTSCVVRNGWIVYTWDGFYACYN